jgi:hypothetical protein
MPGLIVFVEVPGWHPITSDHRRLLLAAGGNPTAAAKREALTTGSARKLRAFDKLRLPVYPATFEIDLVGFLDFRAVTKAKPAKTAVRHACFKAGGCNAVFLGVKLPGRPEKLYDHPANAVYLFRAGLNTEAFLYGIDAGCHKPFSAALGFDFDHAHPASTIRLQSFVIAKSGYLDPNGLRRLQDRCSLGRLNLPTVNFQVYIFHDNLTLSFSSKQGVRPRG